MFFDLGMPEFVAPEVANGEGVGLSVDMWSVGVITHLLLTGVSLFKGHDDADTLDRVKAGRFTIDTEISPDARDFIIKLLMMNANNRMDVRTALKHRWITSNTGIDVIDEKKIDTETLRNYYNAYKYVALFFKIVVSTGCGRKNFSSFFHRDWYYNSSCRTWFRRRPLESAYGDLSGMVYPPGCNFTPEPSPPPQNEENQERKSWRDLIPSQESSDIDAVPVKSESQCAFLLFSLHKI